MVGMIEQDHPWGVRFSREGDDRNDIAWMDVQHYLVSGACDLA
jgi:hypothetical protein